MFFHPLRYLCFPCLSSLCKFVSVCPVGVVILVLAWLMGIICTLTINLLINPAVYKPWSFTHSAPLCRPLWLRNFSATLNCAFKLPFVFLPHPKHVFLVFQDTHLPVRQPDHSSLPTTLPRSLPSIPFCSASLNPTPCCLHHWTSPSLCLLSVVQ